MNVWKLIVTAPTHPLPLQSEYMYTFSETLDFFLKGLAAV